MTNDLTLAEKFGCAEALAREEEAEKHFFNLAQPHFPLGFSVHHRNHGHWDIWAQQAPGKASAWLAAHPNGRTSETDHQKERAFRIRGEDGAVLLFDGRWDPHRPHPRETMKFRSVAMAMLWVIEELMQESAAAVKP